MAKSANLDGLFTFLLFFYLLVYRSVMDYFRLRSKGVIQRKDLFKVFQLKFWLPYRLPVVLQR